MMDKYINFSFVIRSLRETLTIRRGRYSTLKKNVLACLALPAPSETQCKLTVILLWKEFPYPWFCFLMWKLSILLVTNLKSSQWKSRIMLVKISWWAFASYVNVIMCIVILVIVNALLSVYHFSIYLVFHTVNAHPDKYFL